MKVSIIIPTYEAAGYGARLLLQLLNSIANQCSGEIEIVIIDHSIDNSIEKALEYAKQYLPCLWGMGYFTGIKYQKNERGRGNSSINMNEGIKLATGDVIKVMHMDDWFASDHAISEIVKAIDQNPDKSWGMVSYNHLYEPENETTRIIIQKEFEHHGCPSVSFFRNNKEDPDFFDENLVIVNDKEMHWRLEKKYGKPILIQNVLVTIRMHSGQVYQNLKPDAEAKEWQYFGNKQKSLTDLANELGLDKGTIAPNDGNNHGPCLHFTTIYEKYFEPIRQEKLKILEIGIEDGKSLELWTRYFPNAMIYGIDIADKRQYDNDRVKTFQADQSNRAQLAPIFSQIGDLDIIIDDASHVVADQQTTLGYAFQFLKLKGLYCIEDLHTSDRELWQGKELYGNDMSFDEGDSTVDFINRILHKNTVVSKFMKPVETQYIINHLRSVNLFELPYTHYGKNQIAIFVKK